MAGFDDDLAGPLAAAGIDDVVDGDLAFDLDHAPAVRDFLDGRLVEGADQVGIGAILGTHGAEQRHGGKLAALVDADAERFPLRHVDFNPAAALRDDAAGGELAVGGPFLFHHEIDARAAVQLAHDHPLGTVDDELAAAKHHRNVPQIDLFLDRLLLVEAEPDAEGTAVGEPQLAAFVGRVAGLAEVVLEIFELDGLVVAFDGEDLAHHPLEALILPLFRRDFILQESLVAVRLDNGQVGNDLGFAAAAETTDFGRGETPLCGNGHEKLCSVEEKCL